MNKFVKFFVSLILCYSAGFIGSFFTAPAIRTWYATIDKPAFNPPNWIFAPVWSILFFMMAVAFFLVWNSSSKHKKVAMWLFVIHLIFNTLWSILFFGWQSPFLALIDIILLWLMIAGLIYLFYKINKVAGYLLVPYILWVSFAMILNYAIWRLL